MIKIVIRICSFKVSKHVVSDIALWITQLDTIFCYSVVYKIYKWKTVLHQQMPQEER